MKVVKADISATAFLHNPSIIPQWTYWILYIFCKYVEQNEKLKHKTKIITSPRLIQTPQKNCE